MRRQVTGISFLCALHYLNLFRNVPIPEGRSLRRASGLVLVGDQDVVQMGSGESVLGSRLGKRKPPECEYGHCGKGYTADPKVNPNRHRT